MSNSSQNEIITQEEICEILRLGNKPKTEIHEEEKAIIEKLMIEMGIFENSV